MKIGQVLEDGYIFAGVMYDHKNNKEYGLAIAPKDQPEAMKWHDAVSLQIPTIKECNLISANLGHFFDQDKWYWSSTEYNYTYSWIQRFNDGNQTTNYKTTIYRVRCVRRLDLSSFDSLNSSKKKQSLVLKELRKQTALLEKIAVK